MVMGIALDFGKFRRDVIVCLQSGQPLRERIKMLGVLLLERWNAHIPLRWKPKVRFSFVSKGRRLSIVLSLATQDYLAFREVFVERAYDAPLGNPETILDLGANCGCATLFFSACCPGASIAAVEPHPSNLAVLRENIELNHLTAKVLSAAATLSDGPVTLLARSSLSHGLVALDNHEPSSELTVAGISVPTLLSQLGWQRVDLLKVDIEGYERILFAGRPHWLNQVMRIIGEYHDPYQLPELRADLEPMGFTVTALSHPNLFLAIRRD